MKNTASSCLEPGTPRVFSWLLNKIREYRYPIWASLILGLFSYMFAFTNKLVIHDDLTYLFTKGVTVSSGRWGLEILSLFLPDISMPWFHGILTLILITASVCVILHLLQIRMPLLQVLTAGLIVCFPSLIGTFGFMFTSSSYGVSFLLAVLSALFFSRKGWKGGLGGTVCCILSLSIYQAYVSITAGLLILVLVQKTMYTDIPVRKIFLQGLYFLAALAVSMGVYMAITHLVQLQSGELMNSYASDALQQRESLPVKLLNCITILIRILLFDYRGLVHGPAVRMAHLICLAVLGFEILFWCFRSRKKERIFLLLFLLILFPFALNCMQIFSSPYFVHTLVLYGVANVYVLAALVLENSIRILSPKQLMNRLRACLLDLVILCMAVTVYCNCSTANRGYMNLHIRYENNYCTATTLITRLEQLPGFTADTPIALVGHFPSAADYDDIFGVRNIIGVSDLATRAWDVGKFMKYYCGADFNFVDFEEGLEYIYTPQYREMNFYPESDSIRMVDGTALVKLDPWFLPGKYFADIEIPEP